MLDEELVDDCMRSVDACFHLASAVGVQLVVSRPLDSLLRNVRGNDIVHLRRGAPRPPAALHLDLRDLREEQRRRLSTRTPTGSSARRTSCAGPTRPPRRSARRSPTATHREQRRADDGRAAVQHRRAAPDRRLRDGAAPLRPPGARGRRPDRLRQRHAVALLRATCSTRPRHRCSCTTTSARSAGSSTSAAATEMPIIELARQGDRAHRIEIQDQARPLRGGLRRGLRGARPPQARHGRARRAHRLGADARPSTTRSTT